MLDWSVPVTKCAACCGGGRFSTGGSSYSTGGFEATRSRGTSRKCLRCNGTGVEPVDIIKCPANLPDCKGYYRHGSGMGVKCGHKPQRGAK